MKDLEVMQFRQMLQDMWMKPSDFSAGQMKVLLQQLPDYYESGGCTETMYEIFQDMLVDMIAKRESLKRAV